MNDQSITNLTQLNKYWDLLRDHILKATHAIILNHKVSPNSLQRLLNNIVNHNYNIKLISNIYYCFRKKLINQYLWPSPSQ